MPIDSRRSTASESSPRPASARPATWMAPALGRSSPAMTMSRVDLPEPDGPTTPRRSPLRTLRSTPRRMLTGPAGPDRVSRTPSSATMIGPDSLIHSLRARAPGRTARARRSSLRPYGLTMLAFNALALVASGADGAGAARRIVVLGDSIAAGYGLAESEALPGRL